MAGLLIEDVSPHGNLQAVVEDNGDVVYFYIFPTKESKWGMKTCWVRNLLNAPADLDVQGMKRGAPPLLPACACANPSPNAPPDAKKLRVVWFEEGDGAALLEGDDILAVIPGWSGQGGFHGYARDCTAESPLAWPLQPATAIVYRVHRADAYWRRWTDDTWPTTRDQAVAAVEASLGPVTKYYAIDGGNWPPKALIRFDHPDKILLMTIGMHMRRQPGVERSMENPSIASRIELAIALIPESFSNDAQIKTLGAYMSAQSNLPWTDFTWLGDGHTIPVDSLPSSHVNFPFLLLTASPAGAPKISLDPFDGDHINILWMTPITASEQYFAESQSSVALLQRLNAAGVSWIHRPRNSVA